MLRILMKLKFFLFIGLVLLSLGVRAESVVISAEAWARPHSGAALVTWPVLQTVIDVLDSSPASRLSIGYPGGEDGVQWAYELRAWLIALGVAGQRIELQPGGLAEPGLRLSVAAGKVLP